MGAEGLAARPAVVASAEEGGRVTSSESRALGLSLPNPACFPTFPWPCWAQDPGRSEKDARGPQCTTQQQHPGKGEVCRHLATRPSKSWSRPGYQGCQRTWLIRHFC